MPHHCQLIIDSGRVVVLRPVRHRLAQPVTGSADFERAQFGQILLPCRRILALNPRHDLIGTPHLTLIVRSIRRPQARHTCEHSRLGSAEPRFAASPAVREHVITALRHAEATAPRS